MSYTNGFFTYDTIDNNYWNQGFVDYTSKIRHDSMSVNHFSIKKVIFNDPATIVLWEDGTKTVVKCDENDGYDPEKGLAMAISKKALGNKGNYYNHLKKWLTIEKTPCESCRHRDKHYIEQPCFLCLYVGRYLHYEPVNTKK